MMSTDDAIDKAIKEFSDRYAQAPADRPFEKNVVKETITILQRFGLDEREAKSRLSDAITSPDERTYARRDGHESLGDAWNTKDLSVLPLLQ